MQTKDIDTQRFTKVVDAMEKRKDMAVYMDAIAQPTAKRCGCFAGELSMALNEIGVAQAYRNNEYNYRFEADRFTAYITNSPRQKFKKQAGIDYHYNKVQYLFTGYSFEEWVKNNPEIWGSTDSLVFSSPAAFNRIGYWSVPNRVIIAHLRGVINRVNEYTANL